MEPEQYVGDDLKPAGPVEITLVVGRNEYKIAVEMYGSRNGRRYVQIERAFWLLPRDKRVTLNMKEKEMSAFTIKGKPKGGDMSQFSVKVSRSKGEDLKKLAKNYDITTPELIVQCIDYALEHLDPVQQVATRRKQGEGK